MIKTAAYRILLSFQLSLMHWFPSHQVKTTPKNPTLVESLFLSLEKPITEPQIKKMGTYMRWSPFAHSPQITFTLEFDDYFWPSKQRFKWIILKWNLSTAFGNSSKQAWLKLEESFGWPYKLFFSFWHEIFFQTAKNYVKFVFWSHNFNFIIMFQLAKSLAYMLLKSSDFVGFFLSSHI